MALALNNLKRVDMPLNKEIKPNQTKGISPKVNIIARLEFELAYYNVEIQHANYYADDTTHFSN